MPRSIRPMGALERELFEQVKALESERASILSALTDLCAAARWATGDRPNDQAALQNALGKANTLLGATEPKAQAGR